MPSRPLPQAAWFHRWPAAPGVELKLGINAHPGPPLTAALQGPQSTLTTDLIPRDMWYVGGCSAKIPIAVCRHWSRRGGCSTEGGGEGRLATEFWALLWSGVKVNEPPQSRDILYSNLTHRSLCAVSVSVLSRPVYTTSVMVRGSPTIGMYSIIPRSSRSSPQRPHHIHPPRTFPRQHLSAHRCGFLHVA